MERVCYKQVAQYNHACDISCTYTLIYDAENRLTGVSGAATATFVYDGDGNRVKGTVGGVTTTYIGNYYEWSGSTATSYYYAGSVRVAMRQGSTLSYLFADQLGSTSVVANSSGSKTAEVRYKAWGEDRYTSGTVPSGYRYTGQRVDSYINLYWYNSRWYDQALGRFIQPDSIVPGVGESGNPDAVGYLGAATYSALTVDYHENQLLDELNSENRARFQDSEFKLPSVPTNSIAFDRYAYSLNNPIRYTDPTGHCIFCIPLVITLGAVTPVGWVAIGVTAVGVGLYFAVPGVREAVTNGLYQIGKAAEDAAEDATSEKGNDENQEALVDLAQEAKQKGGVSEEDAQTMLDWADEYNVVPHSSGIEQHIHRNFNIPHIRIGPVNHIPVHGR
jgi:RHS repeat-associated protein